MLAAASRFDPFSNHEDPWVRAAYNPKVLSEKTMSQKTVQLAARIHESQLKKVSGLAGSLQLDSGPLFRHHAAVGKC